MEKRTTEEESKNMGRFPEESLTTRWPWVFLDLQISVWGIWKLQPRQAGGFGGGGEGTRPPTGDQLHPHHCIWDN